MRVGLIGFGTIAKRLLSLIEPEDAVEFVGVVVRDASKVRSDAPPVSASLEEFVAARLAALVIG